MAYKIIISPRAQKEIENAIDFYASRSSHAPRDFILALSSAYKTLAHNPFFRVRYKNVSAFNLKKFPFSLYFVIDENRNVVRVLSCFHNKKNPINRPNLGEFSFNIRRVAFIFYGKFATL